MSDKSLRVGEADNATIADDEECNATEGEKMKDAMTVQLK